MSGGPSCPQNSPCAAPFAQSVTQSSWAATSLNEFNHKEHGVQDTKVWLKPYCSYLPPTQTSSESDLALSNMCPALRSNGVDCRLTSPPKCSFLRDRCALKRPRNAGADLTNTGRCEYDLDLLKTPADVSYLLRSSGNVGARIPVQAAAALIDDWAGRMQAAADAGEPVSKAAAANAYCMGVKQSTLGTLQSTSGAIRDWRSYRDFAGSNWAPIYWGQARWLTALMSRPVDDTAEQTGSCIVTGNCTTADFQDYYCS